MSTVKAAEKVLKLLKTLSGYSLQGASNQELAERLDESPAQIHRQLQTLVAEGLAKEENGRFTIGVAMIKMAKTDLAEVERAKARLAEIEQRTSTY